MADALALDLTAKKSITNQLILTIGYDRSNLNAPEAKALVDKVRIDHYGRQVPEHSHGTIHLDSYTDSSMEIIHKATELYHRIVKPGLLIRRFSITAENTINETEKEALQSKKQPSLFDAPLTDSQEQSDKKSLKADNLQHTILDIKKRFGKNSLLRGLNFEDGATGRERNRQIGGHKA